MQHKINRSLYNFIVTFALLSCSLAVILSTAYRYNVHQKKTALLEEEKHTLEILHALSISHFSELHSDIHLLGSLPFPIDSNSSLSIQEELSQKFAKSKRIYDQVRYIDLQGQERIRVIYRDHHAQLVATGQLKNQSTRIFVQEGMKLPVGTIYISPMDLNVENDAVDIPYKPMLRMVTPVTDRQGKRSGIVVLNYQADRYLQEIESSQDFCYGELHLLNQNGQYLLHPLHNKRWSFMFPDRAVEGIFKDAPEVWNNMFFGDKNQLETGQGVYTYIRVVPFGHDPGSIDQPLIEQKHFWILYSLITAEKLKQATTFSTKSLTIAVLAMIFIVTLISLQTAFVLNRKLYYRARLQELAHYDALTGLVNRILLREHIQSALFNMQRYGHHGALLFLDLDGFKPVNDNFGHATGDELLKAVARRLKSLCRATDSVARVGGDEFIILLPHVDGPKGAKALAQKIIQQLNIPFTIRQHRIAISTSIGISMMSHKTMNIEELISSADKAMYEAKQGGKNTYRFSGKDRIPARSNVISIHKTDHT